MILDETFCALYDKFGKDFNRQMLTTQMGPTYIAELNKAIGEDHFVRIFLSQDRWLGKRRFVGLEESMEH